MENLTNDTKKINYDSSKNQDIKRRFIEREVLNNVSCLITELSSNDEYMDELMEICSQEDYKTPVEYYIENNMTIVECMEWLTFQEGSMPSTGNAKNQLIDLLDNEDGYFWKGGYQEFACEFNIDPEQNEALEHWNVSDYLARKLEEKGEMINRDFYGLTVWGRTCSGQAILLDGVISSICEDMEILEGQKNEWK